MEIKILFYSLTIWLIFNLIGLFLMMFRTDVEKYQKEANFIMSKGTLVHKATFILLCWCILPFTIPYSLKNIFERPQDK